MCGVRSGSNLPLFPCGQPAVPSHPVQATSGTQAAPMGGAVSGHSAPCPWAFSLSTSALHHRNDHDLVRSSDIWQSKFFYLVLQECC